MSDSCVGSADRDVVEPGPVPESSSSPVGPVRFSDAPAPVPKFASVLTAAGSSATDDSDKPKASPWGRLKDKVAALKEENKDRPSSASFKKPDIANVIRLVERKNLELFKAAKKAQAEMERGHGLTDESFNQGRWAVVGDRDREKWHESFKSKRRTSVGVNPAMLQALSTVHKQAEDAMIIATEIQARAMVEGRVQHGPMEKQAQRRGRRISGGKEALVSSLSLTSIWARSGTHDDGFRPEINQARLISRPELHGRPALVRPYQPSPCALADGLHRADVDRGYISRVGQRREAARGVDTAQVRSRWTILAYMSERIPPRAADGRIEGRRPHLHSFLTTWPHAQHALGLD